MSENHQAVIIEQKNQSLTQTDQETKAVLGIIERAATDPNVDIDKMERLLEMHERISARNAETAFYAAMSEMQTEIPIIAEDGLIKAGTRETSYSTLENIVEIVKPIMKSHGFNVMFLTDTKDNVITITGLLSHKLGHKIQTSITLPADNSGAKNLVQQIGSSVSYGKRYVLCSLLNIATKNEDDDGKNAIPSQTITKSQQEFINKKLSQLPKDRQDGFIKVYGRPDQITKDAFNHASAMLDKALSSDGNN